MRAPFPKISLVFATLLILGACDDASQQGAGGAPGGMQMPPPEVNVMTITAEDIALTPQYPGRTQGSREVEVRARVGGILLERAYEEGQFIEKGATMFRIDPATYQVALDRARAQHQQAQARLKAAERDWERVNPLFQEKAVSARTRDEALSELETAKAGVSLAAAEVRAAKLDLDYTKVEAPISGIASKETVSEGSLIGTAAADSLLTRMTQLDPIYVNFAYPDTDYMSQRRLQENGNVEGAEIPALEATLTFGEGEIYPHKGTISFTDATINEQTGTVQARGVFPNPQGVLIPGQFVRIALEGLTLPSVITVPQAAVLQGPEGKFVYKLGPDNKALIAPIKTGISHDKVWIVEEGLNVGDVVITEGIIKVQPNQPVMVKQPGEGQTSGAENLGAPPAAPSGDAPAADPAAAAPDASMQNPAPETAAPVGDEAMPSGEAMDAMPAEDAVPVPSQPLEQTQEPVVDDTLTLEETEKAE